MRTAQKIVVIAAILVQIAGLISSWQWEITDSLGAIFLVLLAIWLRLTEESR